MSGHVCKGQVALVTGASKGGTGTAIALRLAAEGAKVAVTARTLKGLEETQRRIETIGGQAYVIPCDLSNPGGGRAGLVERVESELGPIDILVNNAAVNGYEPFDATTPDALERCLQVNLWAPWELMRGVVTGMRARGRGWILNLTSFAAELPPGPPFPTNKPAKAGFQYGASKAALNRLTIAAASECEGQGIAVNALDSPGGHCHSEPRGRWVDQRDDVRTARHHGRGSTRPLLWRSSGADRANRLQPSASPRAGTPGPRPARHAAGGRVAAK